MTMLRYFEKRKLVDEKVKYLILYIEMLDVR